MRGVVGTLHCPGCGSDVSLVGSTTHATCVHCARRIALDPATQRARDEAEQVRTLEREAAAALDSAVHAECAITARTRALLIGAAAGVPALIAAVVVTYASGLLGAVLLFASHSLIVADVVVATAVGAVAWLLLARRPTIEAAAARRLAALHADESRANATRACGKCPSCGAPVMATEPVASFPCGHCGAPLALAHGILIRWVADARARAEAWRWQAFHTRLDAELWPKSTWIAFTLALVLYAMSIYSCGELLAEV